MNLQTIKESRDRGRMTQEQIEWLVKELEFGQEKLQLAENHIKSVIDIVEEYDEESNGNEITEIVIRENAFFVIKHSLMNEKHAEKRMLSEDC